MTTGSMLVTGATGAVGRELLGLLKDADWHVTGIYRSNRAQADTRIREWETAPGQLEMHACDLTNSDQVAAFLEELPEDYCPDVIVHLASPKLEVAPIQRMRWDSYQHQLDGVLKPVVLLTQPFLRPMTRRGGGRIITALSAVVMGTPPRGFASYTTAKYALLGYMRALAVEYAGKGVTVNMVSPGAMNSEMLGSLPELLTDQMREAIPGGEWIDPVYVAKTILWLATEASVELTGCNLPLTAGMVF